MKESLPDFPGSMVIKSVKAYAPDLVALQFSPPGVDTGGTVKMIDGERALTVVPNVTNPAQLVSALQEVQEGLMRKARERRYLHIFRKQHFSFLKRYSAFRIRLGKK